MQLPRLKHDPRHLTDKEIDVELVRRAERQDKGAGKTSSPAFRQIDKDQEAC